MSARGLHAGQPQPTNVARPARDRGALAV